MLKRYIVIASGLLGFCLPLCAQESGDKVVVIYNTRVPESKGVADHYAAVRKVPASQVIGLDLPDVESMHRGDFRDRLQKPLLKQLESKKLFTQGRVTIPATDGKPARIETRLVESKIRYIVLCYGVPLKISEDGGLREEGVDKVQLELRRNGAAVDSELACLAIPSVQAPLTGWIVNPLYACTNASLIDPTNGVLMVARLDGPTATIARALVDKALEAETNGLWGRAYFDLRGLTNADYKLGDDMLRAAAEASRRFGYETAVDVNGAPLHASYPLSQVAFYAGWYDENVSGPFARPTVEFMPGAFAYHLHSFSAASLRTTTRQWAGPLLARGATATMGCVDEPYLVGTPDMAVVFTRLMYGGFSFGEAAFAAQRYLSWQTTVIGDPLYRPFTKTPYQQHDELEKRRSKLAEWSFLRAANLKLAAGSPASEVADWLDKLEGARGSSVLMEKLGDLYAEQGNTARSVESLQLALKLEPSPQQRVRINLALGGRLVSLGRDEDAYAVYQDVLMKNSDYPDKPAIYRSLVDLARKLGKKEDAEKYEKELDRK